MLSAIEIIGACLIVLAVACGLFAMASMLLIRAKDLFKILSGQMVARQGRAVTELKGDLRTIVKAARNHPGRFLSGVAIACTCVIFIEYIMLGLIALGALSVMIAPIARRYGWGSEGLSRHLSRRPSPMKGEKIPTGAFPSAARTCG